MSLEAWGDEGYDGPEGYVSEDAYAELEAERDRLKQHVADLQSGMYINCVYCGHRYGPADTTPASKAEMLKAHILECTEHPMSELKAQLYLEKFSFMNAWIREMSLERFANGVRALWNIDEREYLACINTEDREHFGDQYLSDKFFKDPHKTFCGLPDQDQRRVFAIIEKRTPTRKWTGEPIEAPALLPSAQADRRTALEESVKLQSHYAGLLNIYDGGQRMTFANADEWIARLATLAPAKDGEG